MTPAEVTAHRRLVGLNAAEFAAALGVADRTVRAWEAGRQPPRRGACDDMRALAARHTAYADTLASPAVIPSGPEPRGWYAAAAARLLDRDPDAEIEWE